MLREMRLLNQWPKASDLADPNSSYRELERQLREKREKDAREEQDRVLEHENYARLLLRKTQVENDADAVGEELEEAPNAVEEEAELESSSSVVEQAPGEVQSSSDRVEEVEPSLGSGSQLRGLLRP